MRLLHTQKMRLEWVNNATDKQYAILSHTWLKPEEEVLFADVIDETTELPTDKAGYRKLEGSCRQARKDGYDYIWIDTCCIDKSSSAELSEAINSMFMWYRHSRVCYAYLDDVIGEEDKGLTESQIRRSRWLTRGWTLQELIAPPEVVFFDRRWVKVERRNEKRSQELLLRITGLPGQILSRQDTEMCPSTLLTEFHHFQDERCSRCKQNDGLRFLLEGSSVAQKMSWASRRETTRLEDQAYCLLGLFDINMPLLYGEGKKAFFRLQVEIMKKSDDQSILAHQNKAFLFTSHLLAESPSWFQESPSWFQGSGDYRPRELENSPHLRQPLTQLSSKKISTSMYLCPVTTSGGRGTGSSIGILNCFYSYNGLSRPGILLTGTGTGRNDFYRDDSRMIRLDHNKPVQTIDQSTGKLKTHKNTS